MKLLFSTDILHPHDLRNGGQEFFFNRQHLIYNDYFESLFLINSSLSD